MLTKNKGCRIKGLSKCVRNDSTTISQPCFIQFDMFLLFFKGMGITSLDFNQAGGNIPIYVFREPAAFCKPSRIFLSLEQGQNSAGQGGCDR